MPVAKSFAQPCTNEARRWRGEIAEVGSVLSYGWLKPSRGGCGHDRAHAELELWLNTKHCIQFLLNLVKKCSIRVAPWLHDIPLICSTMKRGENLKFGQNLGGTKSSEIFGIWIS